MKRNLSKSMTVVLTAALAFTSMPISVQAAKTKLSVSNCVLSKGDKINLNVIGAKETSGKYTTSKKQIASVNKKGMVTAKKQGKAKIVWKKGKKKYNCKIKVVKSPTLSTNSLTVTEGENNKVSVSKYGNTSLKVKWSSADTKIATVKKGVITGVSEGTTVITAKIKGNRKTYKESVNVTVSKKQETTKPEENNSSVKIKDVKTIKEAGTLEAGTYKTVQITSDVPVGGVVKLGDAKIETLILQSGEEYDVDATQAEIGKIEIVEKLAVTASAKRIPKMPRVLLGDNKHAEKMEVVVNSGINISGTAKIKNITVKASVSALIELPVHTVTIEAKDAKVSLNNVVEVLNISGNNVAIAIYAEVKSAMFSGENSKIIVNGKASITEAVINASKVSLEGNGKVENLTIQAEGAIVKTAVGKATISEKVESAMIGQEKRKGGETIENVAAVVGQVDQEVVEIKDSQTGTSTNTSSSVNSGSNNGGGSQGGVVTPKPDPEKPNPPKPNPPKPEDDLYKNYKLVWEDSFDGDSLNRNDWNVELHDKGWVNNELQAYVDSKENIYIEDGKLVLKPVETVDKDGNKSYTSGRVNTQGKHDFKYGLFEAKVKVPKGQGFLPAFWMMPTNENLYGQWPRCGEIDIMEVLGNKTDTSYGTIHYGNPHSESQGKYTLEKGSFSEEYHTFQVEWQPGKIKWYVDGNLIHEEDDWYSITEGQGEITYPAPFDQPFYIILNLAVGGTWPGNPDETTNIKDAAYYIDYVKVYQKDSYHEDVEKPIKEVILRDPDKNGNYVNNGDFSSAEDLNDEKDWKFLTTLGGEASAEIKDKAIEITTGNEGTVDYSVQLVQPALPMKRGGVYRVSFEASASEARTMKVDISAPDRGYKRYLEDTTVELTTEKKTYEYEFTMTDKDDANGRLEFNLGVAGSTAKVSITNISVKKIREEDLDANTKKTVLADGNYVYNGSFQEGEKRLGYWDIKATGAEVSVTNEDNIRKLKVVAPEGVSETNPVIISQDGLALTEGNYAMSFLAEGENGKSLKVILAGQEYTTKLTGKEETYNYKLTIPADTAKADNRSIVIKISEPGTFYIDDIRVVEDTLIKNGSFNAGFAGYEPYVDSSAKASYVVDSLNEDNAADFAIENTGDAAWKIQLKQNNIELEKGQWYRLSLDAKSSIARKIMFAIQRDGSSDDNWDPYSGEKIVELGKNYQTYTIEFQMKKDTDLKSILSISMGAVDGEQITEKHRICIDNINLEKIDEPEIPEQPTGENILKNGDFANGEEGWTITIANWEGCTADATKSFEDNKAVFIINNVGTEDWHIQLKQSDIVLEEGSKYKITFKVVSTKARTIKVAMLSADNEWYGGEDIVLEENQEQDVEIFVNMSKADSTAAMVVSMGQIKDEAQNLINTPISTITLSDFSLVKVAE